MRNCSQSPLSRLLRARGGNVSVLFTFALVPLFGFMGLAIDVGAAVRARASLKASTDASALAGVSAMMASRDAQTAATNLLGARLTETAIPATSTVTADLGTSSVTVVATYDMPNKFMSMLGYVTTRLEVRSRAEAGAGSGQLEVAIAIDTTGSMSGAKMDAAQEAAKQLVDTLFANAGDDDPASRVKVGLVPFAAYVNIGTSYRGAPWLTNANDYSTTAYECWDTYPNATYSNPRTVTGTCYNDGNPYSCSWTDYDVDYGAPVNVCNNNTYYYNWYGCVGSQATTLDALDGATPSNKVPALLNYYCPSPLIRLSKNRTRLKNAINDMYASGETYIAPGLLWGWRLLTPNQATPFGDGAAYGAAKKIMILLTDGANTHSANYGASDHEYGDVGAANAKVLETCENIKATGIQVFTIAFSVTDPTIQSVLSQCSSGPPFHYNATTIADLQGAFAMIGGQLTTPRITE